VSGPATADHIVVTLTYDTENGVTLPTPKKIQVPVTMPLADVFARAASINQSSPPPLSFTSLLVGMMASSPSLTEILGRQGATLARIGQSRGQTYDQSSLNRIGAQLLPTELGATVSARRAIETAGTIAASLKSPALDVRHLAAAYPILSNWHVDDFKEFGIDRLVWCRELGAEMAASHPGERWYWRGYTDRASPVPLTSFSADVYTEKDLLGIDRTVDALALLMASTRTDTPLSIGIFGPWGSGKSFFMRHLRRKIFQIPIWMREITSEQRAVVVKSLLGATAAPLTTTPTIGALSGEAPAAASPPPRGSEARRLDGFQAALDVAEENPDPLRITPQEGSFVERVAPLLSDKPRALKRFVNSYRLLKASLSDLDRQTFVVDDECSPYKICLSQLAYFTGQPRLGPVFARELEHVSGDHSTLLDWLDTAEAAADDATRASVLAAARLIPDAGAMRLKDFQAWLPETTRYLFHRDD
jgi:KAP family P-loop domain